MRNDILRPGLLLGALVLGRVAFGQSPVDRLRELVEVNSGTANGTGVGKVQDVLAAELKKIGFTVERDASRLVIGRIKGRDPRTITFLVHADTVFEPSSPFRKFAIDAPKKVATGPGVLDDKGGALVALEGLGRFLRRAPNKFNLLFIVSPAEETGSPGLAERFKTYSTETWMLLGFEPALDDGSIIQRRRGNRWYQISSLGTEAHAGRAHRDGRNACVDLARKLVNISKLTDYARDVTVSVGHVAGGQDKYNVVCGTAEAKVDTRFATPGDRDALHAKITAALRSTSGVKTEFKIVDDSPPIAPDRTARVFIDAYLKIIGKIEGKAISAGTSGGGGDVNYFARPGLIALDGLGGVGGRMHTEGEFIRLESLESRADALNRFLEVLQTF